MRPATPTLMEVYGHQLVRSFPEVLDRANLLRAAITGLQFFVVASLAWRIMLAFVLRRFHSLPRDDHETRAGVFYAARVAYSLCYLLSIPLVIAWLTAFVPGYAPYHDRYFDRPYFVLAFLGWGIAALAAGGVFYRLRVGRRPTAAEAWHAFAFDVVLDPLLLFGLPLLTIVSDRLDGPTFAALGVVGFFYFATQHGLGHALLRLYGTVRPIEEPRHGIAARVAEQSGVSNLTVWSLRSGHANAFAMPGRRVYFSEELSAALDDAQFEALLWHETAHLRESVVQKLIRRAPIPLLLMLNAGPAFVGAWSVERFLFVVAAFLLVYNRVVRHARRLEVVADGYARLHAPQAYNSALRTIHRVAMIPETTGLRNSTHPDLRDRLAPDTVETPGEALAESAVPAAKVSQSRAYWGVVLYVVCFLSVLAASEYALSRWYTS